MGEPIVLEDFKERVILVGVSEQDGDDAEDSLAELAELVKTAGASVSGTLIQKRELIHPGTYVGTGKVAEIAELLEHTGATGIVCDDELSPAQLKNLETMLNTKVMDRTLIILDIFAARATTSEGKIQVELAQLKYRLSRLTGLGRSMSRLGGGIGTRGPGEKKLEIDRRLINDRIAQLNRELKEVVKHREIARAKRERNAVTVVAIVGYTNAGKSTLLNAITGAGIPANNRLFDTLDTTTRLLTVSDTLDVVISDTVGFIRKLPHQLVEAFKATLEELEYADLLLHVIDLSNPQWAQQAQVVDDLIRELKADHIPCLRVYNKCDLAFSGALPREKDSVYISAKTGEGIKRLLQAVDEKLDKGTRRVTIHLPYDKAGLLDGLYREAKVENVEYGETVDVTAVCTPRIMGQLKDYIEGWQEEKEDWEQ